jgi:hypothetical protein
MAMCLLVWCCNFNEITLLDARGHPLRRAESRFETQRVEQIEIPLCIRIHGLSS